MPRQVIPGENVSDMRARWKKENERKRLLRREKKILRKEKTKDAIKRAKLRVERRKLTIQILPQPILIPPLLLNYVPGDKKLSILICTIVGRENKLQDLLNSLEVQRTDDIEILIEKDNRKITVGEKRNILLERAVGDYVAFVDDDDKISNDYISKILNAISTSPDCCGLEGEITHHFWVGKEGNRRNHRIKTRTQKFIHSIQYKRWFQRNKIYYRCPNHLNPIKRELALRVKFLKQNKYEDINFSERIRPLLKTEVYIEGTIYFYLS